MGDGGKSCEEQRKAGFRSAFLLSRCYCLLEVSYLFLRGLFSLKVSTSVVTLGPCTFPVVGAAVIVTSGWVCVGWVERRLGVSRCAYREGD